MHASGKVMTGDDDDLYIQRGCRLSPEGQNVYTTGEDAMAAEEMRLYKGSTLTCDDYKYRRRSVSPDPRASSSRNEENRLNRTRSMRTERDSHHSSKGEEKLHRGQSLSPEKHLRRSQALDVDGNELKVRRSSSRKRSTSKSPTSKTFPQDAQLPSKYDGSYQQSSHAKSSSSSSKSYQDDSQLSTERHKSSSRSAALRESQKVNQPEESKSRHRSRSKSPTLKTYSSQSGGADLTRSRSPSRKHSPRLERTKYRDYEDDPELDNSRKSYGRSSKSSRSRSYEQKQSQEVESSRSHRTSSSGRSKSEEVTESKQQRYRSSKLQRQDEYYHGDPQDSLQVSPDMGKQRRHSSIEASQSKPSSKRDKIPVDQGRGYDAPQISVSDKQRSRKGSTESSRSLDEPYLHPPVIHRKNSAEIPRLRHELTVDDGYRYQRKHSTDSSRSSYDSNTLYVQESRLYRTNSAEMSRSSKSDDSRPPSQRNSLQVDQAPIYRSSSTRSMSRSQTEEVRDSSSDLLQVNPNPQRRRSFQSDRGSRSRSSSLRDDDFYPQSSRQEDYHHLPPQEKLPSSEMAKAPYRNGDYHPEQGLQAPHPPVNRRKSEEAHRGPMLNRPEDIPRQFDTIQVPDRPRRNSFREEHLRSSSIQGNEMHRSEHLRSGSFQGNEMHRSEHLRSASIHGNEMQRSFQGQLEPTNRSRSPSLREDNNIGVFAADQGRLNEENCPAPKYEDGGARLVHLRVNSMDGPQLVRKGSVQVEDPR